jgi:Pentapeptide repeats (8 copies)
MANEEHVAQLMKGFSSWNAWREKNQDILPDLSGADFSEANLSGADFSRADLSYADFSGADLSYTDFSGADLSKADLRGAHFWNAKLYKADLSGAFLEGANLNEANFSEAILKDADLQSAILLDTDFTNADLTGCRVYGVSAWGLKLNGAKQQDLVITRWSKAEPEITVDNIEVAQFIYLLLQNEKLQRVIDTITTKVVLILGRFSLPERKEVLDALRSELRKPERDYVPVVFDFEKPRTQTTINTIMLLARMARFVIADISDAKSVLMELQAIVPSSPKLPVQSIILASQHEPGMFDSFKAYPWFLATYRYETPARLLVDLDRLVITPAEAEVVRLRT